jgi:menaquinone-dependent protoporphyrinogen oxidase
MRVLVAAASKHGATLEIATVIGEELARAGIDARVEPLEDVRSVDDYDGVVVGSGIYAGHWLGAAKEFVDQHATDLALRPLWLFSSGPLGDPLKPEEDPVDPASIATRLGARGQRVFGGRLDRSHLGFGERAIVGLVRAPEGDFRPWDEIRSWSAEIARELQTA